MKPVFGMGLLVGVGALCGCASAPIVSNTPGGNCGWALNVGPSNATANHAAASPANQVQFLGVNAPQTGPACGPIPDVEALEFASWTNPDPINIQISSAADTTNGIAVCKGVTNGAVTLTGVFSPIVPNLPAGGGSPQTTKTVQLTCQ